MAEYESHQYVVVVSLEHHSVSVNCGIFIGPQTGSPLFGTAGPQECSKRGLSESLRTSRRKSLETPEGTPQLPQTPRVHQLTKTPLKPRTTTKIRSPKEVKLPPPFSSHVTFSPLFLFFTFLTILSSLYFIPLHNERDHSPHYQGYVHLPRHPPCLTIPDPLHTSNPPTKSCAHHISLIVANSLCLDGWFSEQSDMWPGQAMNLKVNQVLHHEKSKYQDVLVFESSDYGNVLVLDNVIQCTERDEFSYQEMITHLAMNSHPDPKKVLVIGGGDGGVLREVVKHESVDEAVLCDIDEAVIRLSKKYLPGMSVSYQHPKVKTHIGDGFEFLKARKNEFDVIITDSSDPEGPAESLFQKPYFELLRDALRDGGVITTQGCSLPFFNLPSLPPPSFPFQSHIPLYLFPPCSCT